MLKWKGLVWHGKIIKKVKSKSCPHNHYICDVGCEIVGYSRINVCSHIFVERNGKNISIPMEFTNNGKKYNPACEDTPFSKFIKIVSIA